VHASGWILIADSPLFTPLVVRVACLRIIGGMFFAPLARPEGGDVMRPTTQRHPVHGLFAGLFLGLGAAILLVIYGKIAFGYLHAVRP